MYRVPSGLRFMGNPRTDIVSKETRSRMMRAVRQQGTDPERAVRKLLRGIGVHYRVNSGSLAGSPDFSNRSKRWAIFVNGCFWHGHRNCRKTKGGKTSRVPVQNRRYWGPKIADNRRRDARKCRELRAAGLRVAIVWECQLRQYDLLKRRLVRFVEGN